MRIANHEGRLVVVTGEPGHELAHDVEKNSGGRFGPEPQAVYEDWDAFTRLGGRRPLGGRRAGPPASLRLAGPGAAPGVRHRAELPRPRGRVRAAGAGRGTAGVHQVPQLHHRAAR